jgi:hypothetical protein
VNQWKDVRMVGIPQWGALLALKVYGLPNPVFLLIAVVVGLPVMELTPMVVENLVMTQAIVGSAIARHVHMRLSSAPMSTAAGIQVIQNLTPVRA